MLKKHIFWATPFLSNSFNSVSLKMESNLPCLKQCVQAPHTYWNSFTARSCLADVLPPLALTTGITQNAMQSTVFFCDKIFSYLIELLKSLSKSV